MDRTSIPPLMLYARKSTLCVAIFDCTILPNPKQKPLKIRLLDNLTREMIGLATHILDYLTNKSTFDKQERSKPLPLRVLADNLTDYSPIFAKSFLP